MSKYNNYTCYFNREERNSLMVNTILKLAAVTSLVLGSIVVAATVFTAKEIDNAGDKLGKNIQLVLYKKASP